MQRHCRTHEAERAQPAEAQKSWKMIFDLAIDVGDPSGTRSIKTPSILAADAERPCP
jgi:hypothetical protein